ncbi:MAG TPA: biotin carboxylase N-terminal domain-containing protein [Rhodanobacteraceae bacterium]|nr:biotin carboxylase N-terminal domain-containing protein [Rhodanobacteraceae bacterium]
MFDTVLIANRGEIACRVIRTCRTLGIRSVAVFSEADANARHVRVADVAYPIGGPRPSESYLRGDVILEVAKKAGAQAIHPGYGFLSENAAFARACSDAGVVFIGPKPESIEAMGSKAEAKALMERHGVPLVPGYHGEDQNEKTLLTRAKEIGFPLMIKAAAGGGGKGMRIVRSEQQFADALASAQREAQSAFGDARMILERYIEHPRHIEFQVFGDMQGNVIHLNERECSAQRRYQKVLEETPSPFLDETRRAAMGTAAVAAAKAVNYIGAGTVEFIVGADGDFHFMEMNTRLQVEHPVTEETLGLDLVEWQLRIASGEALPLTQDQVRADGNAIEVRLYAEDPEQNFLPGSGKIEKLALPQSSRHVRVDAGVDQGDSVSIFYDPMIAKLIVWDEDRPRALARMREALAQCEVVGPKSNIAFLERLVRHPAIGDATIDTGYLDRHLDEFLAGDAAPSPAALFAAATAILLDEERTAREAASASVDPHSPWNIADAWRIGHPGKRIVVLASRGERYEIEARGYGGDYELQHGDTHCTVHHARIEDGWLSGHFGDAARRIRAGIDPARVQVHVEGGVRELFARAAAFAFETQSGEGGDRVLAPMPGRIVLVKTKAGDEVQKDQELLVMEAMKMELTLRAPRDGKIETVNAAAGDFVEADAVLVKFGE